MDPYVMAIVRWIEELNNRFNVTRAHYPNILRDWFTIVSDSR
ncbi:hypothetical protein Plhal304r1_c006g0025051 [Plasmopara halstedii]